MYDKYIEIINSKSLMDKAKNIVNRSNSFTIVLKCDII